MITSAKPVDPRVLLARIRALLRRHTVVPVETGQLDFGPLRLDSHARTVRLDEEPVELSTMEFELLWLLATCARGRSCRETTS